MTRHNRASLWGFFGLCVYMFLLLCGLLGITGCTDVTVITAPSKVEEQPAVSTQPPVLILDWPVPICPHVDPRAWPLIGCKK